MEGTEPISSTFHETISYHINTVAITLNSAPVMEKGKKKGSNDEASIENSHMTSPDHEPLVPINYGNPQQRVTQPEDRSASRNGVSNERARNKKGTVDRAGGPATGLNRTGKSCRLRWVNYLHPGLKRGRMTPQEERLVLELHSKWGNRWSRIARRLPGRTDNEIKNYWRTHMRKMAQEAKRNSSPPSASSSSNSLSSMSESPAEPANAGNITEGNITTTFGENEGLKVYPMDQIWNEIETSESVSGLSLEEHKDEACNMSCPPPLPSPMWDYNSESLWKIDDHEEFSMIPPMSYLLVSNYHHGKEQS